MLIVGARGFAKEVLEIQYQLDDLEHLTFYDDVNLDSPNFLFDKFPVLKNLEDASLYLKSKDNRFTLGLGNPILRKQLYNIFIRLGGVFTSTISPKASVSHYGVTIGKGCNILDQAIISNDATIGMGTIIYYNSMITHDVTVGDFVEVSPGVSLLGRIVIGDFSRIGSQATILADINIGSNVIVGAGAVVTKNIPNNCMVAGVPAIIKKNLEPLSF